MLGVENLAVFGDFGPWGPSAMSSVAGAHMAVQSGACEVALVVRSVTREWGQQSAEKMLPPPSGMWQWDLPYGIAGGMIPVMAMKMRRRFHTLGGTPEDYGHIAVNARRWSSLNERAVLRDLITMDDYLNSRMVSDPLHLFDCDYPVTGAVLSSSPPPSGLSIHPRHRCGSTRSRWAPGGNRTGPTPTTFSSAEPNAVPRPCGSARR